MLFIFNYDDITPKIFQKKFRFSESSAIFLLFWQIPNMLPSLSPKIVTRNTEDGERTLTKLTLREGASSFRSMKPSVSVDRVTSASSSSRLQISTTDRPSRRLIRAPPPKRSPKYLKPIPPKKPKKKEEPPLIELGDAVSEFLLANTDNSGVLTFEQFQKWYETRCRPKAQRPSPKPSDKPLEKQEEEDVPVEENVDSENVDSEDGSVSPLTISSPTSVRTIDDFKAQSPFAEEAQRVIEEETAKTDAFAWLIDGDGVVEEEENNEVEDEENNVVEGEEKEQNEEGQEEEEEETTQEESTEQEKIPSKQITVKSRTASHEAFDWLMSPVSERNTEKDTTDAMNNSPIEEEAEEGNRVMEEEGVVL